MTYAILRTKKLKSFGEIGGSLAHTFRTRHTPNADPGRFHDNEHMGGQTPEAVQDAIRKRLPEKRRSDAVLCIEYFIGASPEFFEQGGDDRRYFSQAVTWLVSRHGRENVVSAHVHRDETSPHLVAYVVPRDGDKLNAKKWLGGKALLSAMQTDFHREVGLACGLERGIEGSAAEHQTIREYYAKINAAERQQGAIEVPRKRQVIERGLITDRLESDEQFAERVAKATLDQVAPRLARGLQAESLAKREREQARKVNALQKALDAERKKSAVHERLFEGLDAGDRAVLQGKIERLASEFRHQIEAVRKAAEEKARKAMEVVRGWFRRVSADGVEVEYANPDTGMLRRVVAPQAAKELTQLRAAPGDLVEISGSGGKIIERAHEQQRGRDRDPGEGRER